MIDTLQRGFLVLVLATVGCTVSTTDSGGREDHAAAAGPQGKLHPQAIARCECVAGQNCTDIEGNLRTCQVTIGCMPNGMNDGLCTGPIITFVSSPNP
jgi:hypothetical protein